jgi:formate hydrogenlyase subunit 3/multisubunit Na+/H+ antiporter MnhD subunit
VAVLVAGGLMAAAYLLRFLLPAFRPVPENAPSDRLPAGPMGWAAMTLATVSLLLGLGAEPVLRLIGSAAPSIGIAGP